MARTEFELTANGTVLLERYSERAMPGGGKMATAYHLDGNDLVLTHYCIANNQPVLRAERFDAAPREIQFEFLRAGNLAIPGSRSHAPRQLPDRRRGPLRHRVGLLRERRQKKMTETETFTRDPVEGHRDRCPNTCCCFMTIRPASRR